MLTQINKEKYTQLVSNQRSGTEQYGRFDLEVPETRERVSILLGYRRCHDFDGGDQPGQDFAVVRGGEGYIVGVVADGVSQSFYGNIAASYVATLLLDALWETRESPLDSFEVESQLKSFENEVAPKVQSYPLPTHLPSIQQYALEMARKEGSQTVLAAFVLDVINKKLRLYQVGDVTALVYYPDAPPQIIRAQPKGRWSSAGMSQLLLEVNNYDGSTGVLIKSDGLDSNWGLSLKDNAIGENSFRKVARELAQTDDVSFVAAFFPGAVSDLEVTDNIQSPIPTRSNEKVYDAARVNSGANDKVPGEETKPYSHTPISYTIRESLKGVQKNSDIGLLSTIGSLLPFIVLISLILSVAAIFGILRFLNIDLDQLIVGLIWLYKTSPRYKILIAGLLVGTIFGVLITTIYRLLSRDAGPTKGPPEELPAQGEKQPKLTTHQAKGDGGINVACKEILQKDFSKRIDPLFRRALGKRLDIHPGDAVVFFSIEDINMVKIELSLDDSELISRFKDSGESIRLQARFYKGELDLQRTPPIMQSSLRYIINVPGQETNNSYKSFFIRLRGMPSDRAVKLSIQLLDFNGYAYKGHALLRARQSEKRFNWKPPATGLYQILISRT